MATNKDYIIGQRIRTQRRRLGMTQTELSKKMGITPGYLSSIERGVRRVSGRMIHQFHEQLNLSYDYLLEGVNPTEALIPNALIRETPNFYNERIHFILSSCTTEELNTCYYMIHSYLQSTRKQRK